VACAGHQHHRGGIPQVVDLRMAFGAQLLEALPSDSLAFDSHGDCVQLLGPGTYSLQLQSARGELELWIPAT
jgi:hypothetical protein